MFQKQKHFNDAHNYMNNHWSGLPTAVMSKLITVKANENVYFDKQASKDELLAAEILLNFLDG